MLDKIKKFEEIERETEKRRMSTAVSPEIVGLTAGGLCEEELQAVKERFQVSEDADKTVELKDILDEEYIIDHSNEIFEVAQKLRDLIDASTKLVSSLDIERICQQWVLKGKKWRFTNATCFSPHPNPNPNTMQCNTAGLSSSSARS